LQKAIEDTALRDDAHYRLAQVYRRMGETEKAQQETEPYQASLREKEPAGRVGTPRVATIRLHTSRTGRSRAERVSPKTADPPELQRVGG